MIPAHRIETVLTEDGKLSLSNLPFRTGQTVEVIILPASPNAAASPHPLQGKVLRYDQPTASIAETDWSALQ